MKKCLSALFSAFLIAGSSVCFAQNSEHNIASAAFVQGTTAYRSGEWMSAVFMLRRAVSYPENYNEETWYMLISAEMYAGEYKTAYQDSENFLTNFPESQYVSNITYNKGKALFCLGEYERSILVLSDFCHLYPEHEMYASALFWIGESFYAGYNYDEAEILYARIVSEYPDEPKASEAQYRLETIAQNAREEKLLYLLKETGEEYLAAKEEYERQLKLSGSESAVDVRRRIMDLQLKNSELEKKVTELEKQKVELEYNLKVEKQKSAGVRLSSEDMLIYLKEKARETEQLLKQKENGDKSK